MATPKDQTGEQDRAEKIRSMIADDYERISATEDPFIILNLDRDITLDEVRSRYERYEKFYRAENFQRFGDMDLTRKALDIRRAIGRAMVAIQASMQESADREAAASEEQAPVLPTVDDDCAAMGDIYFRDGLTYLKLGDLNSAEECLQRAVDYDPSRGIVLAYLGYTEFKLRGTEPGVADDAQGRLERAARMDPDNAEIYVLTARFAINTKNVELAREALDVVEELRENHPKLRKLRKRLAKIS